MAKKYISKTQGTDPIISSRNMIVAAPYDVRSVVDTYNDLFDKNTYSYTELYIGMLVITYDTQDVYVLSKLPGSRDNAIKWKENIKWKKINASEINPADYLSYYQEQLGAKVLNSADGLVGIANPFTGQLAYVKDDPNTSEDESGLYIYTGQGWKKIFTGNSASGSGDISSVITTDGTIPSSGTGFSISANDPDALIEETYVDNGFEPNTYYTSRGLSSSDKNGGNALNTEYIKLTKGGGSYIQLNSADNANWIEISIVDDSLGFGMKDVTWIDSEGVEHQMTESPLVLPKETPISFGDKVVDFKGMTETRSDGSSYIFGNDGSAYSDVDIYTSNVLPTVYAYADGTPVRVLTEGDRYELENMISEATDFSPITDEQIRSLFE